MNIYGTNYIRSFPKIWFFYKIFEAFACRRKNQWATGRNIIQECCVVDRRKISPKLSQVRQKAWSKKVKYFLNNIRIRDIITLEHMEEFI